MSQVRTRLGAAALMAIAALLVVTAATATGDPLRIALQKSDFSPGAFGSTRRSPAPGLGWLGVEGLKAANLNYTWSAGGTVRTPYGPDDKSWQVVGDVFVAPSESGARKLFERGKRTAGLFSDVTGEPEYVARGLPRYGDEQFAYTWTARQRGLHGVLFVRKGTVVWQLMLGALPLQWRVPKTQLLRELQTVALKQKARVGAG